MKTFSLPVDGTCGPRHRSMKSPSRYRLSGSLDGIEAMISALYFSPMPLKNSTASSRDHSSRVTTSSFLASSAIFFSMAARSSGVKGRLYEKS
ncbi:hypothetical protein D3C71_1780440 [compost metagenome]